MRPAVVIVTHETCDEALGCLASIPFDEVAEVVVVDSGSSDGTSAAIASQHPDVRLLPLVNVGFGRAANAGIRATSSEHVIVCNADVRFTPGALPALARCLEVDAGLAAVGPLVRYPDGTLQASARRVPAVGTAIAHALLGRIVPGNPATRRYHGRDLPPDEPREVEWLSGCALGLRRDAVEAVGGFDPGYFLYVEDLDLGERLRAAGWRLRFEPTAQVVHRVGASTSRRRGRSLLAHARSIERHQARRLGRGAAALPLRGALRVALGGWVVATWVAERATRDTRSITGERRVPGGAADRTGRLPSDRPARSGGSPGA